MQTAAIIFLVLWIIFSIVNFLRSPVFVGSIIESVVFGFIFAAGTIAMITITLFLAFTAFGLI